MGKEAKINVPKKKIDGRDFIRKMLEKQLKNKLKNKKVKE